ncbi:Plasma membrane calcium-transporting ATPase 2, partial [Tetrabaena socialis]
ALLAAGTLSLGLAAIAPPPAPDEAATATAAAAAAATTTAAVAVAATAAAAGPSTDWLEGVAILATVALVVLVNAATGYARESKFRQINSAQPDDEVRVIRAGRPAAPLPSSQLLVGDLVVVQAGEVLAADGLLVGGGELRLDQSHLTGESEEVIRAPAGGAEGAPVVLSGSKVLDGYGRMLVLAVGPNSQQGSINDLLRRRRGGGGGGGAGANGNSSGGDAAPASSASTDGGGGGGGLREDTLLTQKLQELGHLRAGRKGRWRWGRGQQRVRVP